MPMRSAPSRGWRKGTDPLMTRAELKPRVTEAVDRRADEIIALGETIRRHPELGFKEVKTAKLVEDTFQRLGVTPRTGLALTGGRAGAAGQKGEGPTVALIGERDAPVVGGHPPARPA